MTNSTLIPIILCGGSGTRLWPLSRASYPKQYWDIIGTNNQTLLQQTQLRLKNLENTTNPLLICHENHRFIVAEQMRNINIKPQGILLEPSGRNTAPAITIAALKALEIDKDPLLLILPADHKIENNNTFHAAICAGKKYAETGRLVTFGIKPQYPETGYGYIKSKDPISEDNVLGIDIAKFVEKPNAESAQQFIKDNHYTWNSGMFLFKASVILNEIERLEPYMLAQCKKSLALKENDLDFLRLEKEAFSACPNIPIDIAVMENTELGTVLPLDAGWSDLGNWNALWALSKKDIQGNRIKGKVITKSSTNCYLRSEHRLIAAIGLKNLIVVETGDAILICNQDNSQEVKDIVNKLDQDGETEGKFHQKIYRPWGNYTSIVNGKCWQVKKIEVKPGESLSLQMHRHRAEHWIIVKGTAMIERDQEQELLVENQSTYIPLGCKHRLSNPGKINLELIEVQSGTYLGEDDIIRFEDNYGR